MVLQTPLPRRDEAARLATLASLDLLHTAPEREFDAIVALTARLLDCPLAMLSLLDSEYQWVKARHGDVPDTFPRSASFCDTTIRGSDLLVVDDAAHDPQFATLPGVASEPHLRFYAGAPLHAADVRGVSHAVGTLCVLGFEPRALTAAQRALLTELGAVAEALIAARRTAHDAVRLIEESERQRVRLAREERIMLQAERMAMMGSWRLSLADDQVDWSDNVYRIHGLPVGVQPPLDTALNFYPPAAREIVESALMRLVQHGELVDIETDFITADGRLRRVRSLGELEHVDGKPVAIVGIVQDVTEQYTLQQALRRSADADALTGIANRAAFDRTLEGAMAAARADSTPLMLALIDLDGFKAVNDTLGHLAGDDVLKGVARQLREPWLRHSFAARLGGDEFVLIVQDAVLCADPLAFAERLEDTLRIPATGNGLTMVCGGTVGTAAFDRDFASIRDFVHRADTMLYAAKRGRVGRRRQPIRAA